MTRLTMVSATRISISEKPLCPGTRARAKEVVFLSVGTAFCDRNWVYIAAFFA